MIFTNQDLKTKNETFLSSNNHRCRHGLFIHPIIRLGCSHSCHQRKFDCTYFRANFGFRLWLLVLRPPSVLLPLHQPPPQPQQLPLLVPHLLVSSSAMAWSLPTLRIATFQSAWSRMVLTCPINTSHLASHTALTLMARKFRYFNENWKYRTNFRTPFAMLHGSKTVPASTSAGNCASKNSLSFPFFLFNGLVLLNRKNKDLNA